MTARIIIERQRHTPWGSKYGPPQVYESTIEVLGPWAVSVGDRIPGTCWSVTAAGVEGDEFVVRAREFAVIYDAPKDRP